MIKMPAPKPKRRQTSQEAPRRRLKPNCSFPDIQIYRQANGDLWLSRYFYNGVWITGTADDERSVIDNARQFYMTTTKQGQLDSELDD